MKYFLDTYALIEIAEGNKDYARYVDADVVTLKNNIAELFYFYLKKSNKDAAQYFFTIFGKVAFDVSLEIIPPAMNFRFQHAKTRFSYTDCLGYAYALEHNRIFVTGDRAFQGFPSVEIVR